MKESLFEAVRMGSLDAVSVLLTDDSTTAIINSRDEHGRTALHIAAEGGYVEIAQCLLAKGANVNATDFNRKTPLHLAAAKAPQESGMVKFLCNQDRAMVDAKDNDGMTPLMHTSPHHPTTIRCLLESGADVRVIQTPGRSFQEKCLPFSEAFKAVLDTAPNCLMTSQNEYNTRLAHNLKRRIPKDKPRFAFIDNQIISLDSAEKLSFRKMVMQLLDARIHLTQAYVCLFHGEPLPGEINRHYSEAFKVSRDLVVQEVHDILDRKHLLLKNQPVASKILLGEINTILSQLSREALTNSTLYLSSPDPPDLEKFKNAIIQASKLSLKTVTAEIDALNRNESFVFNSSDGTDFSHFVTNLIKIASSYPSDGTAQLTPLLDHVGLLLQQNYMDLVNQQRMNPNNTEPIHSKENLQLSLLCLLHKKPVDYNADVLYNLSALVSDKANMSSGGMTLESLVTLYPKSILRVVEELEQKHENITGIKYDDNQSSPFSKLKELASQAKVVQEQQKHHGNEQENLHAGLPQWAARANKTEPGLSADRNSDKEQASESPRNKLRDITPKTSPR